MADYLCRNIEAESSGVSVLHVWLDCALGVGPTRDRHRSRQRTPPRLGEKHLEAVSSETDDDGEIRNEELTSHDSQAYD